MPGPSARSAPPTAASMPSIATALASIPPDVSSASTTAASSGSSSTKTNGASPECEESRAAPGSMRNGQPKAAMPDHEHRGEREAGTRPGPGRGSSRHLRVASAPARPRSGSASAAARAPWRPAGRTPARTPRRRRSARRPRARRRRSPSPGWRPRRRARRRGWRGGRRAPVGGEVAQDLHEPVLRGVVEAAGRLVEQQQRRPGREHDRQRQREPLPLGQVAGVLRRPARRGTAGSNSSSVVPAGAALSRSAWAHSSPTVAAYSRSPGTCGTRPTWWSSRLGRTSAGTCPSTTTRPPEGRFMPTRVFSRVDLPAPLRPIRATTSPRAIDVLTPWSAGTWP